MGLDLCFSKDDWDPEGFTENFYFSKQSSGDGGREGYPERLSQQFIKGFPVQTFSFFSQSAQVIPYQQADTACLQGHRLSGFVESRGKRWALQEVPNFTSSPCPEGQMNTLTFTVKMQRVQV